MVSAFGNSPASLPRSQHPGKRREVTQPLRRVLAVTQTIKQLRKTLRRQLRPRQNLPPLLQPMRRRVTLPY